MQNKSNILNLPDYQDNTQRKCNKTTLDANVRIYISIKNKEKAFNKKPLSQGKL